MIWDPVTVTAPKYLRIEYLAFGLCLAGGLAMVNGGTAELCSLYWGWLQPCRKDPACYVHFMLSRALVRKAKLAPSFPGGSKGLWLLPVTVLRGIWKRLAFPALLPQKLFNFFFLPNEETSHKPWNLIETLIKHTGLKLFLRKRHLPKAFSVLALSWLRNFS